MALKREVTDKVRNEEKRALLISYARTYRLKTVDEVKNRLDYHINKCRKFLATNRFHGTVNHKRREYTQKLEHFMSIKKVVGRL